MAEVVRIEGKGPFWEAAGRVIEAGGVVGLNEYGTPVSIHTCPMCGQEFTVCPPVVEEEFGAYCMAVECASYDSSRDAEKFFDA